LGGENILVDCDGIIYYLRAYKDSVKRFEKNRETFLHFAFLVFRDAN